MPAPRRSCLAVPGSSERMLAKAPGLGADEIVIDLEDAVVPAAKDEARARAVAALAEGDWAPGTTVSVRVNAPRTPWCHLDVLALATASRPPASLVLPKVESPGDLAFLERLLDGVRADGGGRPIGVQALIETARGLAAVGEIAAASPRLECLVLGYLDLAASLGRPAGPDADLDGWRPAQHAVLVAARAHGLQAIDGPHPGTTLDAPFEDAATRARDLGFDGKWAIHPAQVAALTTLFTPSEVELRRARDVLAALNAAERDGRGAVALEGEMLDEASRRRALRTLASAADTPGGSS